MSCYQANFLSNVCQEFYEFIYMGRFLCKVNMGFTKVGQMDLEFHAICEFVKVIEGVTHFQ